MKRQVVSLILLILALLATSCAGWRGGSGSLHRPEDCPLDLATPYEYTVESLAGEDANEYERLWARNVLAECHERRGEYRQAYEDYYAARNMACESERMGQEASLDADVTRRYCDEYGPQALERVGARLSPQEREEIQAEEEQEQE
ncbi:hypothetical protein V6C53_12515 [Desulfocurvibacter africanus]|uniref:Lipoprotein n=1 Tax=Desulfocurvibacter africanus subsp. africanus str. Walvis Bay TaxID=690850 RepID=F3Z1K9_DESAF|nr:hypothetical protein [Desulfocurvibacter africanus]EGJ50040.1 hypothetical protein Desaf_1704 [Desulfocurvibacter africanus subsp. africanus str. Walvis Bay]